MAQGTWALSGTTTEQIIAANADRDHLTIQLTAGTAVHLGFGTAAVAATGVKLLAAGDSVTVDGWLSRLAVNAIGGADSVGGWQDGEITLNV